MASKGWIIHLALSRKFVLKLVINEFVAEGKYEVQCIVNKLLRREN